MKIQTRSTGLTIQERLDRLYGYCQQDVEVERELYERLPPLSPAEQAIWELSPDQRPRLLCRSRLRRSRTPDCTGAAPEIDASSPRSPAAPLPASTRSRSCSQWLQEQGCTLQKLDQKAIERQLERAEELPATVQRVLELRLGGAQAAAKKIDALLARAGDDDRVRGAFRYHGAATGRWSGEGFQPQNLKRPAVEDLDAADRCSCHRRLRARAQTLSAAACPWLAIAAAA